MLNQQVRFDVIGLMLCNSSFLPPIGQAPGLPFPFGGCTIQNNQGNPGGLVGCTELVVHPPALSYADKTASYEFNVFSKEIEPKESKNGLSAHHRWWCAKGSLR